MEGLSLQYRLRVSPWTSRITLQVRPDGRLEVIAPRRTSRRRIAAFLAEQAEWIRATRAALAVQQSRLAPPAPWMLPETLALPAIEACWAVLPRPTALAGIRITERDPGRLEVVGQLEDGALCRKALQRWLLLQGRRHLLPWLAAVSQRWAFPYARSAVRLAHTRWGSCSRAGAISLNARLLLVPPPQVEYVLLHELCHTREPNHSAAFWALVGRYCPDYPRRRAALRTAGRQLPAWAETSSHLVAPPE